MRHRGRLRGARYALLALAFVAAGPAFSCNTRLAPGCLDCEVPADMIAQRSKPCRFARLQLSGVFLVGGGIIEAPRLGRATVSPDHSYEYVSDEVGTDRFMVAFYGQKENQPVRIIHRVSVQVTE